MLKRFCDHCGSNITDDHRLHQVQVTYTQPPHGGSNVGKSRNLDLCVSCARTLMKLVGKPVEHKAVAA